MESNKHIFRVDRSQINYLRVTIESYDGMGVVRTLDPHTAIIEVQVAPGCEDYFSELVNSLVKDEGLAITEQVNQ